MEIAQTTKMEENQRRSVHFKTDPKVTPNRSTWFGKLDFVMSALSFAIGLGNLWRFPYMCYRNGGGAFLVPFLVMTLVAGFPLIFLECYFGQYGRVGIVTIWKVAPLFQGIGWTLLVSGWACAIYYNVLIAYAVFYLFASFASQVPWKTCGNSWNTANCARIECARNNNKSFGVACPDRGNFTQDVHSPADEFFHHRMLGLSGGLTELGNVRVELAACLFLCWFIILISLSKGIESSGKVAYITASLPYFVLIAIFFRAITLEGATNGLLYFITPVWDRVIKPRVWGDAAIQVFYSMSICDGGLITLASYNRFHNNCFTDAVIIAVGDCLTSVLCGAVIFAVLGYMAHDMDITVDSVVSQGAGLAYVVYPSAVANLPMSSFWAVIFMLMVINLGLGTMFGIVTTTHTTIMDVFPTTLRQGRLSFLLLASICFVTWLMGLICTTDGGMYVLQLMDAYSSSYILLLVGVIEPIVLCWIYGIDRIFNDIKEMIGSKPGPYFYYTWKFIAPALISAILISQFVAFETLTYGDYMYPLWADVLGWVVVTLEFALIPGVAFYKVYSAKDDLPLLERIRSLCRPTRDWGQRLDISNEELPPDDDSNQMGTNVVQTESMNVLKHNSGLLQPGVNPMEETEAAAEMFVTGR